MTSLVLNAMSAVLQPLLLLFSIFLLISGHSEPGGGFSGGLMAASAFVLHAIAYNPASARRGIRVPLIGLVAAGLGVSLLAGLLGTLGGSPFLKGRWTEVRLPGLGQVDLGTPLLFDLGVYLVVTGVTLIFILSLAEE